MEKNANDGNGDGKGYFPPTGYITVEEMRQRLQLRDGRTLQANLEKLGIKHATLGGRRLYRCESIEQLFWEDNDVA